MDSLVRSVGSYVSSPLLTISHKQFYYPEISLLSGCFVDAEC